MTDIIGYVRVSTREQEVDIQIEKIKQFSKIKEYNILNIYSDHASGKNTDRPGFSEMIEHLGTNPYNVQAVIIYKLDRIGRSLQDLIRIADWLKEHNIGLISVTDNIDTTTSSGRLFYHMIGAFAEYERELILERTSAGLAKAQAEGKTLGRPVKSLPMDEIKKEIAEGIPKTRIAKKYGISTSTLYNKLNE